MEALRRVTLIGSDPATGSLHVFDLLVLALGAAGIALMAAYAALCDRI